MPPTIVQRIENRGKTSPLSSRRPSHSGRESLPRRLSGPGGRGSKGERWAGRSARRRAARLGRDRPGAADRAKRSDPFRPSSAVRYHGVEGGGVGRRGDRIRGAERSCPGFRAPPLLGCVATLAASPETAVGVLRGEIADQARLSKAEGSDLAAAQLTDRRRSKPATAIFVIIGQARGDMRAEADPGFTGKRNFLFREGRLRRQVLEAAARLLRSSASSNLLRPSPVFMWLQMK